MTSRKEYLQARETLLAAETDPQGVTVFDSPSVIAEWTHAQIAALLTVTPLAIAAAASASETSVRLASILKTALPMSVDLGVMASQGSQARDQIPKLGECEELFLRKNKDYGDTFRRHGPVGVLLRLTDKLGRLASLVCMPGSKVGVQDESLGDTLMDMINYCIMAQITLDSAVGLSVSTQNR